MKKPTRKTDPYEVITQRMIELLEQGTSPWQMPYNPKVGFPANFASGNRYRGINVFLLGMLRYSSPYFMTYRQAKSLGGQVRKGEKGAPIVKYGTYVKKDENRREGDEEEMSMYLTRLLGF